MGFMFEEDGILLEYLSVAPVSVGMFSGILTLIMLFFTPRRSQYTELDKLRYDMRLTVLSLLFIIGSSSLLINSILPFYAMKIGVVVLASCGCFAIIVDTAQNDPQGVLNVVQAVKGRQTTEL